MAGASSARRQAFRASQRGRRIGPVRRSRSIESKRPLTLPCSAMVGCRHQSCTSPDWNSWLWKSGVEIVHLVGFRLPEKPLRRSPGHPVGSRLPPVHPPIERLALLDPAEARDRHQSRVFQRDVRLAGRASVRARSSRRLSLSRSTKSSGRKMSSSSTRASRQPSRRMRVQAMRCLRAAGGVGGALLHEPGEPAVEQLGREVIHVALEHILELDAEAGELPFHVSRAVLRPLAHVDHVHLVDVQGPC